MTHRNVAAWPLAAALFAAAPLPAVFAQTTPAPTAAPARPVPPPPRSARRPPPVSPEIGADRRVTFRLEAPRAQEVRLESEYAWSGPQTLTKDDNGVWSVTVGPLDPGEYRYHFAVDGVTTVDPNNPRTSESLSSVSSLLEVPGSDLMDIRDVPHGAVAAVWYHSKSLNATRRMHVYTPPGYEADGSKYPVLYLLHGAGDSDESWSSVGHAGFILDNLIAAGKARPMIVVMPAGHVARTFGPGDLSGRAGFREDFLQDIMPYVQSHYRTQNDRAHRAMAGLSMGGNQTLNVALPHLDQFGYVGIFSSGWFNQSPEAVERDYGTALNDAKARQGLRLLWVGYGSEDFAGDTSRAMLAILKQHGFTPQVHESGGGHTWINWRDYLGLFAPQLFQ